MMQLCEPFDMIVKWYDAVYARLPAYPEHMAGLFLKGLALIYLAAFASMATQIVGLMGSDGILPARDFLAEQSELPGISRYRLLPTLFWLNASDTALQITCYAGMAASLALLFNRWTTTALIACFLLYLSIVTVGQTFTSFQWDALLLETGFLAIFLCGRSRWIVFLYRLLIARFMLMGGIVKIASHDPAWANLTALDYHYLTQPLPSPLAYYAYWLPAWFQMGCVAAVLLIELVMPFFVFLSRPLRLTAAWSFILLQVSILLTGNFAFFNLNTVLLCLWLLEDRNVVRGWLKRWSMPSATIPWVGKLGVVWTTLHMATLGGYLFWGITRHDPGTPLRELINITSTFSVINNYGPFAVMTTERLELIVEGSSDGITWQEYGFRYKPDALDKQLRWNIPHQPRLDWQFWFAALPASLPRHDAWMDNFLAKLQAGSPSVLALLAHNPFPTQPPEWVRTRLYRYTYATPTERQQTGNIWHRKALQLIRTSRIRS